MHEFLYFSANGYIIEVLYSTRTASIFARIVTRASCMGAGADCQTKWKQRAVYFCNYEGVC